jgi:hypothetical protein
MVMGAEILAGHKLHHRKIHPRPLHKVFGAVVAGPVFPILFVNYVHSCSLKNRLAGV